MTKFLILAVSLALATPLHAQDPVAPDAGADLESGADMMREGARRLLRGLVGEIEPRMRELAEALEGWNLDGIDLDDLGQYHPPEILPNGDIILRRRTPLDDDTPMDGEVEL